MAHHNSTPASILNAPQGTHIETQADTYRGGRPKGNRGFRPYALSLRMRRAAFNVTTKIDPTQLRDKRLERIRKQATS